MKNFLKIKQGGVLGRNLKHARKVNVLRFALFAFAITLFAGTFASAHGHSASVFGVSTAIVGFGATRIHRDPALEGGAGGGETPEQKLLSTIGNKVKELLTPNETLIKDLRKELDELKAKSADNTDPKITKEIERLAGELKAMQENPKSTSKGESLAEQITKNKDLIKKIAQGGTGEVVIKATTQRSDIANNQQAYDLTDIGQLATRKLSLYDIFPKVNIGESNNNGVVRYYDWDEDTIARAAAAVAELGTFPESTAKFKKGSITLQKIGDTLPVSDEFFEDEAQFASELDLFLNINVQLEMDRQLADGDGSGNQITGLKASVNAYSLPAIGTVEDANIYDLIVKLAESITTTGGSKYSPNFAVMNIADINKMKLSKDDNDNYLLPPFVSKDGKMVDSIMIFESNVITANTMVLGDSRFARIYEKGGVVLSKGMIESQFIDDEMTLKARKRMAFLIRAADKGGFVKVTSISAAVAAIDTTNT